MKTRTQHGRAQWKEGVCKLEAASFVPLPAWLGATLALAAWACGVVSGQNFGHTVVKDFSVVLENYKAPYETQMKSLLQGAEYEPVGGSLVLIRRLLLQTFTEKGEVQMVVRAPHCIFDTLKHTVFSDGPLQVQSGDGQYRLEGEGFLFQQTNSVLIISNQVQTVIHSEPQKSSPK